MTEYEPILVSRLTEATTPLTGEEIIPGVQGGNSVQMKIKDINSASLTYAELETLSLNSQLVPGVTYEISDYRTKYTQPISLEVITCDVEPILLTAISVTDFSTIAYSSIFPEDILYYSFKNNAVSAPGADRGYISRRIDTKKNVDVPFDFRYVKFRRWGITASEWDGLTTYAAKAIVKKNNKIYISACADNLNHDPATTSTESTLNTYYWVYLPIIDGAFLANDSLGEVGGLTFTPTTLYEDYLMFPPDIYETTRNILIERGEEVESGGIGAENTIWYPVNSVFLQPFIGTYRGTYNISIKGDFYKNTFLNGIRGMLSTQTLFDNLFCGYLQDSLIQTNMFSNIFASYIDNGTRFACNAFRESIVGKYIGWTEFTAGWVSNNIFTGEIVACHICGGDFSDNIFQGFFKWVNVKGIFKTNKFLREFQTSTFQKEFSTNTILGAWTWNTSNNYMNNNTFKGAVKYNEFEGWIKTNTFDAEVSYCNFQSTFTQCTVKALFKNITCRLTGYSTFNGAFERCNLDNNNTYNTYPAAKHVRFGMNISNKDFSLLTLTDKVYEFSALPDGSVLCTYIDDFGIENSTII